MSQEASPLVSGSSASYPHVMRDEYWPDYCKFMKGIAEAVRQADKDGKFKKGEGNIDFDDKVKLVDNLAKKELKKHPALAQFKIVLDPKRKKNGILIGVIYNGPTLREPYTTIDLPDLPPP